MSGKNIQWLYSLDKDANPPQCYLLSHLQLCKQHSAAYKGPEMETPALNLGREYGKEGEGKAHCFRLHFTQASA